MMEAYDNGELKEALRSAEKVLEAHPNHPECMAFKALTMNAYYKNDDGLNLIKQVIMKNMKNFTCWHV